MPIPRFSAVAAAILITALPAAAKTFTVAKTGSADYTSVQAAIDAAETGDEIVISDTAVYEEQVTIDSTKSGLRLRSRTPAAAAKPTIRFRDTVDVNPTTCEEATAEIITFDRNGALRIFRASGIIIEGIRIDGGGVYPFGGESIWPYEVGDEMACFWPLQHGNAALTVFGAGETVIRDCDISGAYFGIYIKDRNEAGAFAYVSEGDTTYPAGVIPLSKYGRGGNHLVELNRIHHNSFGVCFESVWDGGSTVRYNLFYENHHPSAAVANKVKDLTSEGSNQPGGAIFLKDQPLSPLAIYNNTFRRNLFTFIGNWRPGATHLVFNNIIAEPYQYWTTETTFGGNSFMELSPKLTNRMYHCVYAAQVQKPSPSYVAIMNNFGNPTKEGDLIPKPFPVEANIRWLETAFLSDDTSSELFTMPDWGNSLVQQYIVDQGWPLCGVRDPDGSAADLGAVPQGGGHPLDVVTITPAVPPVRSGDTIDLTFNVNARLGAMVNPRFTSLRLVKRLNPNSDFGDDCPVVAAGNITTLPIPDATISLGTNHLRIPFPADSSIGKFAFFEMFVEGTGSDGRKFTSAAGFIPYRAATAKRLIVELWNRDRSERITEIRAGEPAILRIKAMEDDTTPVSDTIRKISISLGSRLMLRDGDGTPLDTISGGIAGMVDIAVIFPPLSAGTLEFVTVAGRRDTGDDSSRITTLFLGNSPGIVVKSGSTAVPHAAAVTSRTRSVRCELIDLRGRVVQRMVFNTELPVGRSHALLRNISTGSYILRTIKPSTGKVTLRRIMVVGRGRM